MTFAEEVRSGERFEFGRNWGRFLSSVTEQRIQNAVNSLSEMLQTDNLRGLRPLDIGCGSGLSSIAARRLGASVHSFDYDPQSAACTLEQRRRFLGSDQDWMVEQGSALDDGYLRSLGAFDVVYSWGVLHHTGAMWKALENALIPIAAGGQGAARSVMKSVAYLHVNLPRIGVMRAAKS